MPCRHSTTLTSTSFQEDESVPRWDDQDWRDTAPWNLLDAPRVFESLHRFHGPHLTRLLSSLVTQLSWLPALWQGSCPSTYPTKLMCMFHERCWSGHLVVVYNGKVWKSVRDGRVSPGGVLPFDTDAGMGLRCFTRAKNLQLGLVCRWVLCC